MFVLAPNWVLRKADAILDELFSNAPSDAATCREEFKKELLGYFNEHGSFPPIEAMSIVKAQPSA